MTELSIAGMRPSLVEAVDAWLIQIDFSRRAPNDSTCGQMGSMRRCSQTSFRALTLMLAIVVSSL
jgi:hypothetical protein